MENDGSKSDRTQLLASTYLNINEEGRDVLDRFVQKLEEIKDEPEKFKKIGGMAINSQLNVADSKIH